MTAQSKRDAQVKRCVWIMLPVIGLAFWAGVWWIVSWVAS